MDFCSKVSVQLLLKGVEEGENKNILTSPLSYNTIMNMIAVGSSNDTLVQILRFLERRNIVEVNSESAKYIEITCGQTRNSRKRKSDDAGIATTAQNHDCPRNLKFFPGSFNHFTTPNLASPAMRAPIYPDAPLVRSNIPFDQFSSIPGAQRLQPFPYFTDNTTTNGDDDGEGPIISFLNGVWVNKDYCLKDSFLELIQNLYKAKIKNVDCGKPELVVKEANEWANASTKGLVKEVLSPNHINKDTILTMGNVLYFKGSWKSTFIKSGTENKLFHLLDNKTIRIPYMTGCKEYSHQFFKDCQVARIPYSDGGDINRQFAMYIFLPYKKDGLLSLLRNVNSNPEFFNQHCKFPVDKVDIFYIPKFKFSYLTEEGPNIMKDMGLTLPFDIVKAEFDEMIDEGTNLCVSNIVQKAFIEVNEQGTEAAAVTFATMVCYGSALQVPRKLTKFIADHPFMFVIREENSGVLFFVGTLLNPKAD